MKPIIAIEMLGYQTMLMGSFYVFLGFFMYICGYLNNSIENGQCADICNCTQHCNVASYFYTVYLLRPANSALVTWYIGLKMQLAGRDNGNDMRNAVQNL